LRRVRLSEHAASINHVSEACRVFGISRKTYYERVKKAEQYGLSALLPKERRGPHQSNAMTSEEVAVILAEAVSRPALGAGSLLRHLKAGGSAPVPRWGQHQRRPPATPTGEPQSTSARPHQLRQG
jgi:hypothetical protein